MSFCLKIPRKENKFLTALSLKKYNYYGNCLKIWHYVQNHKKVLIVKCLLNFALYQAYGDIEFIDKLRKLKKSLSTFRILFKVLDIYVEVMKMNWTGLYGKCLTYVKIRHIFRVQTWYKW